MNEQLNTDIIDEILEGIELTFSELINQLSSLSETQINIVPFIGSWTAGQLAEHLILSGSGFINMLNDAYRETEREPDELVPGIRNTFLNLSTKMSSPEFVIPEIIEYEKAELLNSLEKIKEEMKKSARSLDLTKTCTSFKIPAIGELTRLECVYFVIYHTQRHIFQLKNIYKKLNEMNGEYDGRE